MAKNPIRPGTGQESLSLVFDTTPSSPSAMHLFDRMSLAADGQERMDAARAYAADRTPTPSERALLNAAELRRRARAYPEDDYSRYVEELERAAETGQRWAPSRTLDPDPVVETHDPAPPHGYNYLLNPGPVVGDDPTPIDGLARQAPVYPTPLDVSIASRHLPRLQWEAHERAIDLRDQTPSVGIINEGDPIPEFPQPEMPYTGQITARDDKLHWYDQG